jgi:tellurite resistance protein TerC
MESRLAMPSTAVLNVDRALLWVVLAALLVTCLAVDFWFHRRPRDIPLSEGVRWTVSWAATALLFGVFVWLALGSEAAGRFAATYLTEWSLSIDNMLVLVVLIAGAAVPRALRHRVLLVGAVGAIALRLIFIVLGVTLIERFAWLLYAFGGLLLIAGVRLLWPHRPADQPRPPLRRLQTRLSMGSPLIAAMALVIVADVAFAIDSIPAAFALSLDPFIVFSANAFAVVGLRSLYFVVEGTIHRFRFVKPALGILLSFVSMKMLLAAVLDVPVGVSLVVIATILGVAALASWLVARRESVRAHLTLHAPRPGLARSPRRASLAEDTR